MKKIPVIYIAGPYRGINRDAIELNIQTARQVGLEAIRRGWSPIIPHANTGHLETLINLPDQFWLDATLELMRRCDAVLLCPGHTRSVGTFGEIEEARRLEIPVFESSDAMPDADYFLAKIREENTAGNGYQPSPQDGKVQVSGDE